MLRLIEPDPPASGEGDRGQTAPANFLHWTTLYRLPLQRFHRRLQVVAHEVELVQVALLGRMKRGFRGRQRKDQPAVTCIDRGKFENIAKESAVAFRVLAVNDDMSSVDHRSSFSLHWMGSTLIFQQLPRNHQALDFACPLADRTQFHVAIKLLCWIVLDE